VTAPLIALGIIVAVVGLVVVGIRALMRAADSYRAKQLAGPAAMLGLMPADALPADLPPFELLNTGKSRDAAPILRGIVGGVDVVVFDYMFNAPRQGRITGLHYHNDIATMTIACAKGAWLNLPAFAIEPDMGAAVKEAEAKIAQQVGDGAMGKVAHALMSLAEGMAGAQAGWRFADRPEVKYVVRTGEQTAVRGAFTPPVLDFFRDHRGWIVEGQGDWLLVTFSSQVRLPGFDRSQQALDSGRLAPDQLDTLVHAATGMIEAFRGAAH
jgi:hypothetical protein